MIHWNTPTPPEAPFFASIFNYYLSDDLEGYADYDEKTLDLVKTYPGYLGYESMKHDGRGNYQPDKTFIMKSKSLTIGLIGQ